MSQVYDLLSIDPGVHWLWCTGWIGSEARELYAIPATVDLVLPAAKHLAIEKPRYYGPAKSRDLIDLAIRVGWAQRSFSGPFTEYTPNEWKGSTPKKIDQDRTWRLLSERERAVVKAFASTKVKRENIMDSVGIGAKWWGRR